MLAEPLPFELPVAEASLGIPPCGELHFQLSPEELLHHTLQNGEGTLTDTGALACETGRFTGRSPKDKFIVRDPKTAKTVHWGDINQPFDPERFEQLHQKMRRFLKTKTVYARYAQAGAASEYRLNLLVLNTQAWQNLFANHLFLRPNEAELTAFVPEWTLLCIPEFEADPATDGTRQANFTLVDFSRKIILIGGTGYAGEMKKAVFTVLNFLLPVQHGVLPMHCAANVGADGDTALFFGLSGTGKTTLSADPARRLIGDDEHGWADDSVFNFEGGCYAKVVDLSAENEPEIFAALRDGAILENTRFVPGTRTVDFTDQSRTENTRGAYPLDAIPNAISPSVGSVPRHIFFLTADAFGVLPPLARLTPEQAMYYFLSGYTAKLAGTEMGVCEPQATFSACFGAAFLPLHPVHYAEMLGEKLRESGACVWLVNTGWTGGPYGTGSRMSLAYTRTLIRAALEGALQSVAFRPHAVFGLMMPTHCPGVPSELLNPRATWADKTAYDRQANRLAWAFRKNFQPYAQAVGPAVLRHAPEPLLQD